MYEFKKTPEKDNEYENTTITFQLDESSSPRVEQVTNEFLHFLRACGYQLEEIYIQKSKGSDIEPVSEIAYEDVD